MGAVAINQRIWRTRVFFLFFFFFSFRIFMVAWMDGGGSDGVNCNEFQWFKRGSTMGYVGSCQAQPQNFVEPDVNAPRASIFL
jgi:hypothetical protein